MINYKVIKRTFEANKFPKGSEMRVKLNKTCVTSEYGPSNKFCLISEDGKFSTSHRSKSEAEKFKLELNSNPTWKRGQD